MKPPVLAALLVLALAVPAPAWAGFDEGRASYNRGDYAEAIVEFKALAEEGHVQA